MQVIIYFLFLLVPLDSCYLSHVMRKPVLAICGQQRRRSACASAQSDQRLCYSLLRRIIPPVSTVKLSSLYLVSTAVQSGLSFTWSETPKTGFFVKRLIYAYGSSCIIFHATKTLKKQSKS